MTNPHIVVAGVRRSWSPEQKRAILAEADDPATTASAVARRHGLHSSTTTPQSYAYPSTSNQLSSVTQGGTTVRAFVYDAAGNITSDTRSGTAYTISQAGRIAQVTVGGSVKANYLYDGRNRLSVRHTLNMTPSGTTHLIHDVWDHVLAETNGAGQAVREYIWLGDLPVAVLDGSATPAVPTLLWVHADHLGRPELLTDASKAIKWKALYEPFGTVWSITGPTSLQMRSPGQWFQIEAGLAYNWRRHYDSTIGRYTQADFLGIDDGPAIYGYAGSNPIQLADYTGLSAAREIFNGKLNERFGPGLGGNGRPAREFLDDIIKHCSDFWKGLKPYQGKTKTNGESGKTEGYTKKTTRMMIWRVATEEESIWGQRTKILVK